MIRYYTSILAKQLYLCQANFQYFFIFFENFPIQHLFTHTLPPNFTFDIHKKRLFRGLYARSMSVTPGAKKLTHQRVITREEIVQVSKY